MAAFAQAINSTEEHRAQQDQKGTPGGSDQLIVQGDHPQLALIADRIGMGLRRARTDALDLRARGLQRDSAPQPGRDVEQLNLTSAPGRDLHGSIEIDIARPKIRRK